MQVAVIGAGSWGTTVAALAAANAPTTLWARRPELAAAIGETRVNSDYLPDLVLPENLHCTSDLEEAVSGAEVIVSLRRSPALSGPRSAARYGGLARPGQVSR